MPDKSDLVGKQNKGAQPVAGNGAENDPAWGEKNPFRFDVSKENGVLVIHNSMEEYMRPAPAKMRYAGEFSYREPTVKDLSIKEESFVMA